MKVAVYGSLRKGLGNHYLLKDSEYLGDCPTDRMFTMKSLGGFPAIIAGEDSVTIEVYDVDQETFGKLDQLEGYPSFYNRQLIDTKFGKAWIYFLAEDDGYHKDIVSHGDWKKYVKDNNYRYF